MSDNGTQYGKEFEGCRRVTVDSNQRVMDARMYSTPENLAQLLENAYAVFDLFNATECTISVVDDVVSFVRARNTNAATRMPIRRAVQVLDNGLGIPHKIVDAVMRYGFRGFVDQRKKLGCNNHGLKAACSGLSPAWALLFSKYKDDTGAVRCCIIGYGSNFDLEMNMDFVIITWPDHVKCETWQELQEHAQGLGGETAFRRLFRQGGEAWAPLEDLSTAYEYLDQILETGVLGLFPMGQPLEGLDQAPAEVIVTNDDIVVSIVSMAELVAKHFVEEDMRLSSNAYWKGYKGFTTRLQVADGSFKEIRPYKPAFITSPPITVKHRLARHTVVYGPYTSLDALEDDMLPYNPSDGKTFSDNLYKFHLTSESRVMNPLHDPESKHQVYGADQSQYYEKQGKANQNTAAPLLKQLLESMCNRNKKNTPAFKELTKLLEQLEVFKSNNPLLKDKPRYREQMKNLKWLLAMPLEVFVNIDLKHMFFNTKKTDLAEPFDERQEFYAAVHTAVVLDILKRMKPGLEALAAEEPQPGPATPLVAERTQRAARTPARQPANRAPADTAATVAKRNSAKRPAAQRPAANKRRRPNAAVPAEPSESQSHSSQAPLRMLAKAAAQTQQEQSPLTPDTCTRATKKGRAAAAAGSGGGAKAGSSTAGISEARFGRTKISQAIRVCLAAGDEEVRGVVAEMASVEDVALSEVLSEYYHSTLSVLVVETRACQERMAALLSDKKLPLPDMLPLDICQDHSGPRSEPIPSVTQCGAHATSLLTAATGDGAADGIMPQLLPHETTEDSSAWPQGCLGYSINLVRPQSSGDRTAVLKHVLGGLLVFETKALALEYREHVTQELEMSVPDIITLDKTYIKSNGIVSGASFSPEQYQNAQYRFGRLGH